MRRHAFFLVFEVTLVVVGIYNSTCVHGVSLRSSSSRAGDYTRSTTTTEATTTPQSFENGARTFSSSEHGTLLADEPDSEPSFTLIYPPSNDGDVADPATLVYEIIPAADDGITNNTRCTHTQLAFTKETLLHVWEIKGLIGYISYIKRFDQPFEVKTEHVSFKSDNVDGKWSFKVHKVRHHIPFSVHSSSSSSSPTSSTTNSASSSASFVPGIGISDIGDIRIVATYSYEAKQPRNTDFIIRPTLIHGGTEIPLPAQKSTSPTIIQQKYYSTRGYQLNSNFLEYVYTFTWTHLIGPLNDIKSSLFTSKLHHYDTQADEPVSEPAKSHNHNQHHEDASDEFFEEVTKTDFTGHFGDVTLKFVIQAYFPEEPVSVTSSRCNSTILDLVINPNLLDKLVASGGKPHKDVTHAQNRQVFNKQSSPPYLRYANSMIYDDRFTDVILVVGEQEIPAHRIILATSSPVFSAILENTTLTLITLVPSPVPLPSSSSSSSSSSSLEESKSPCHNVAPTAPTQLYLPRIHIEPPNVGVDCVEQLLRYIYTGSVDNLKMKKGHLANQLILLADKYDLPELKRHCETILLKELTADNAIEMYLLATRVSSARMMRKALIVMKMNKARLATQTEEFRELSMRHPTLMYELFLSD